jgi:hypothetical protein
MDRNNPPIPKRSALTEALKNADFAANNAGTISKEDMAEIAEAAKWALHAIPDELDFIDDATPSPIGAMKMDAAEDREQDLHDRMMARKAKERAERIQLRKALYMSAASCQGGHSSAGQVIAEVFGVPFPIRMKDLLAKAKAEGFDPVELWPWWEHQRKTAGMPSLATIDG